MKSVLGTLPEISDYRPLSAALARAREIGEKDLEAAIKSFVSMPQSTRILANPVRYTFPIQCGSDEMTLKVRGFAIRGTLDEDEIVRRDAGPIDVFFVGLFGRRPGTTSDGIDERAAFAAFIDDECFGAAGLCKRPSGARPVDFQAVAEFVRRHPGIGPETAMQAFLIERKAAQAARGEIRGINEDRDPAELLTELIAIHLGNVVTGAAAIKMNRMMAADDSVTAGALAEGARGIFASIRDAQRPCFDAIYSALVDRQVGELVGRILQVMGTIQTHHGSAGSNVVARYLTALHVGNGYDFFAGAHMALDGDRHFGAIHDMTRFITELQGLSVDDRNDAVRKAVIHGGMPTYGHPEISAAGRGNELQQDPRASIYVHPLFDAIDAGELTVTPEAMERLRIAQRIYCIAFVEGVKKPDRIDDPPLRLTPNTDFGAWCVQEALGIPEQDRTFLTYVFRGFGWMMDAREQLQQKIIRPVIPPAPEVVPKDAGDPTIPQIVVNFHNRLADGSGFAPS
ncbi:MAG: hypothetical protein GY711_00805 [bacterium]|nr:hypothetical protein [bacterium]